MDEQSSGSISVQLLAPMGTVFVDELEEIRLCVFALAFDRHAKSKYTRFQRTIFELHLRSFMLFVVVVLLVAQVHDQPIQAMRNSDPRVRIVLVLKLNSNCHSIFTLWIAVCDFQYGSNNSVHSNPTFWVR